MRKLILVLLLTACCLLGAKAQTPVMEFFKAQNWSYPQRGIKISMLSQPALEELFNDKTINTKNLSTPQLYESAVIPKVIDGTSGYDLDIVMRNIVKFLSPYTIYSLNTLEDSNGKSFLNYYYKKNNETTEIVVVRANATQITMISLVADIKVSKSHINLNSTDEYLQLIRQLLTKAKSEENLSMEEKRLKRIREYKPLMLGVISKTNGSLVFKGGETLIENPNGLTYEEAAKRLNIYVQSICRMFPDIPNSEWLSLEEKKIIEINKELQHIDNIYKIHNEDMYGELAGSLSAINVALSEIQN